MTIPKNNTTSSSSICSSSSNHVKRQAHPRRICLFGTSANPPTGKGGHVGLVEALVKSQIFDEVRILPVYQHTFSSKRNQLVDFSHRVAMCELAFSGIGASTNNNTKVVVSRAEQHSFRRMCSETMTDEEKASLRVGTADLLEMLIEEERGKNKNSNDVANKTEFSFCLGADTFMDLTDWKWKRSKDVLKLLEGRLVVVNRKQQHQEGKAIDSQQHQPIEKKSAEELLKERVNRVNSSELANGQISLLEVPTLDNVSSSKVRNSRDRDYVKNAISSRVLDYMVSHNLYGFGNDGERDEHHQEGAIIG